MRRVRFPERVNRRYLAAFSVLGTAVIGVILLAGSRAAGPYIAAEAEQGTLSGVTLVNDTEASDAKAIRFGSGPCVGTAVTPSTNIQTAINNAANGTTFCFAAGTYTNVSSLAPKPGQIFDGGNRAAILDGGNVRAYAFRSSTAANVTIRGFKITRYNTQLQDGAIHSFGTTGWTIEDNWITQNASTGVATDTGSKVLNNKIDYNGQQGYAAHGENFLYEGNEIAYNNADLAVDMTWEAGGGKAWDTRYAVFRNNHSHHNGGHGFWDDTNNIYITYDGNNVHDNYGGGIYHEIGYDATIINNTITNNGTATSQGGGENLGWMWDAGIVIRHSQSLDPAKPLLIENNTVTDNYNGIALIASPSTGCSNTDLGEGRYGPCAVKNVLVRNNVITMKQGGTGAVQDGAGNAIFTSNNVKFENNTYHVSNTTTHPNDGHAYDWFAWNNDWHGWNDWKAFGNDVNGSFSL